MECPETTPKPQQPEHDCTGEEMDLPDPADRFVDHGIGELMSNWSITDKDGNKIDPREPHHD